MIDRKEINRLTADLFAENACNFSRNLLTLLHALIEEYRVANDDADVSQVVRNQGKIAALKDVRDRILKTPLPKDASKGINLT